MTNFILGTLIGILFILIAILIYRKYEDKKLYDEGFERVLIKHEELNELQITSKPGASIFTIFSHENEIVAKLIVNRDLNIKESEYISDFMYNTIRYGIMNEEKIDKV